MKKQISIWLMLVFIFTVMAGSMLHPVTVNAKDFGYNYFTDSGNVLSVKANVIRYRTCEGSSPELWSDVKTVKITKKTKIYKATSDTTGKKSNRRRFNRYLKTTSDNYVFLKTDKDGKLICILYGEENYTG